MSNRVTQNKRGIAPAMQQFIQKATTFQTMKGMSREGSNWLTTALDPFHDSDIKQLGYPDGTCMRTYIKTQVSTVNMSAPGTTAWDCHVCTLPEMWGSEKVREGVHTARLNMFNAPYDKLTTSIGNLTIRYAGTGTATWCADGDTPDDACSATILPTDYAVNFKDDPCRVIAQAFEVHDTTAELYKQGSVIVYRMPQHTTTSTGIARYISSSTGASIDTTCDLIRSSKPPGTVEEAIKIPGSKQWESHKGVYCVGLQTTEDNHIGSNLLGHRLFCQDPWVNSSLDTGSAHCGEGTTCRVEAGVQDAFHPIPFDTVGAYFSNLNVNTVLSVTFIRIIEYAPEATSDNMCLTSAPAPFDPVALHAYTNIVPELPAGVWASMNAKGEWWSFVKTLLKTASPVIDKYVFNDVPVVSSLPRLVKGVRRAVRGAKQSRLNSKTSSTNPLTSMGRNGKK